MGISDPGCGQDTSWYLVHEGVEYLEQKGSFPNSWFSDYDVIIIGFAVQDLQNMRGSLVIKVDILSQVGRKAPFTENNRRIRWDLKIG